MKLIETLKDIVLREWTIIQLDNGTEGRNPEGLNKDFSVAEITVATSPERSDTRHVCFTTVG